MALRTGIARVVPAPVMGYARGLAMSIIHNVPAYGFSIVASGGAIVAAEEIGKPSVIRGFLYVLGASTAFACVGALGAAAFEEERVEDAAPQAVFIGSVLSIVSTSAGFGASWLAAHFVAGGAGWFLCAFCATVGYVLVLALEMELATLIRGSRR